MTSTPNVVVFSSTFSMLLYVLATTNSTESEKLTSSITFCVGAAAHDYWHTTIVEVDQSLIWFLTADSWKFSRRLSYQLTMKWLVTQAFHRLVQIITGVLIIVGGAYATTLGIKNAYHEGEISDNPFCGDNSEIPHPL